jgi:hypothetical protein
MLAFTALALPAQARIIVLTCYWTAHPEVVNTYHIDLDAKTVTTTANSSPMHRQLQTYPAQITDQTIRYWAGNMLLGTIDRYSGILDAGSGFLHKCQVVEHGPMIR